MSESVLSQLLDSVVVHEKRYVEPGLLSGLRLLFQSRAAAVEFEAKLTLLAHESGTNPWIRNADEPEYLEFWNSRAPLFKEEAMKHLQPENSELSSEVYQDLMSLADKFDSRCCFSAAGWLREIAGTSKSPAFGYHWSRVHVETGEVISSGFSQDEMQVGIFKDKIEGFERRVIPLFASHCPQPES